MISGRQDYKDLDGSRTWICVPLILYEVGGIFYAPLAQMGEHSTFNRVAMGPSSIWSMTAWILNFDNRR